MRRQINLKFVLALMVSVGVLAAAVHFVHGFQVKRQAVGLFERSKQAEEEGKVDQAIQYLGRYLGFKPSDNDALAHYGELLDSEAKRVKSFRLRQRGFAALEQALQRLPADTQEPKKWRGIRRRQVDLALDVGEITAAIAHAKTLLDDNLTWAEDDRPLNNGERAELEQRIGLAEELRKHYAGSGEGKDGALEWYQRAAEHDPGQVASFIRQASILRLQLEAPEKADKIMEEMIDKIARSDAVEKKDEVLLQAYLARARYSIRFFPGEVGQRRADLKEMARKDVEEVKHRARQDTPEDIEKYLVEAELALAQENVAEARKVLKKGEEAYPSNSPLREALANLDAADGRIQEAIKEMEKLLEDRPDRNDLLFKLAELHIQGHEPGKVEPLLEKLKEQKYPPERVAYLTAQVHLLREEWGPAGVILEKNRQEWRDAPKLEAQANLFLGQCYEHLGNADQALAAYQQALKLEPASVPARRAVAASLLALGRSDEALAEYRQLLSFGRRPLDSRILVARLLIARTLRLPAEPKRDWTEPKAALALAARELAAPMPEKTDAALVARLRGEVILLQADVTMLEDRKQIDKVRTQLQDGVKVHPEFWLALATLDGRDNKPAAALRTLKKAEEALAAEKDPKVAAARGVDLHLARISYLARLPEAEARPALAAEEKSAADWAADVRPRLLEGLAAAYSRIGATADADHLWQQVAKDRPNDLPLRLLLLDQALKDGKDGRVTEMLADLRRIEGDLGTFWRFGEAARLVLRATKESKDKLSDAARGWLGEARGYLDDVAKRRPSWYRVPALQGEIADLEGQAETATDLYQRAVTLGDRRLVVLRRLGQHQYGQNRWADLDKFMKDLLPESEQTLVDAGLGKLASLSKLGSGDQVGALKLALKSGAADSKNYRDQILLGQLYTGAGKKAEAEKAFRKACDLAKDAPDPWVTLVVFLAVTDRKAEAEAVIEQARKAIAPDRAPLALANCYAVVGQKEKAEKEFQTALAAQPGSWRVLRNLAAYYVALGDAPKAETHLRKLLEVMEQSVHEGPAAERAKPVDLAGARRALASVLASAPNQRQFDEALGLLEQNLKATGNKVEDRRLKAALLATRLSRRKAAIALFEEVKKEQPLSGDEQYTLFRLYEAEGNWSKAQTTMLILLASPAGQKNAVLRARYARRLIRRGQIEEADLQLKALKDLKDPKDPKGQAAMLAKEIEARLWRARGDDGKVLAALDDYAAGKDSDLGIAAVLADEFGQEGNSRDLYRQRAERLYRKYVKESKSESRYLALASFLARQGRFDETYDACQEALRDKVPPEAVANILVAALRSGQPAAMQFDRVERWFKDTIPAAKDADGLLVSLADLRDLQARYQDAESLYTQVLRRKEGHLLALNNLAWLLAVKEGRAAEALQLVSRAIALVGPSPELLDTRGVIYLKLGKIDQAIKDFQACIDQTPSPSRYFHLALAENEANQREAAVDAWGKTKGLDVKQLHPLEQGDYLKLLAALAAQ